MLWTPPTVNVTVSTTGGAPFEHRWKRSFGSGHASLTLRADWRSHLTAAATELGLAGVRYHGLFDDDMHVVTAPGKYDFSAVDSTWDFLIASGVRPIVELSFMPAFVANCSWHGHCKPNPLGCEGYWCTQCDGHGVGPVVNPGAPACTSLEFHYQGIKQLPRDLRPWYDPVHAITLVLALALALTLTLALTPTPTLSLALTLALTLTRYDLVHATVTHAVQRYGLAEVQRWSFEV